MLLVQLLFHNDHSNNDDHESRALPAPPPPPLYHHPSSLPHPNLQLFTQQIASKFLQVRWRVGPTCGALAHRLGKKQANMRGSNRTRTRTQPLPHFLGPCQSQHTCVERLTQLCRIPERISSFVVCFLFVFFLQIIAAICFVSLG